MTNFAEALKNRNYKLLLLAFFCIDGSFVGFGSIIGTVFGTTNLGPGFTSLLCGITVLCGLAASLTTGALIQRFKTFRLMMRLSCIGCLIICGCAVVTFALRTDSVLISTNTILLGMFIVPIIPISINFSSELTYPIEPTVITGTLLMTGQLGGFIIAVVAGYLCNLGPRGASWVWLMFFGFASVGSVCSIIV